MILEVREPYKLKRVLMAKLVEINEDADWKSGMAGASNIPHAQLPHNLKGIHQFLCFIEVKTRRGLRAGSPAESVNFFKRRKLVKLAYWYMKFKGLTSPRARFDVVGITRTDEGGLHLSLFKNAFDLNDAGY